MKGITYVGSSWHQSWKDGVLPALGEQGSEVSDAGEMVVHFAFKKF